jgi:O-antigen/teichoic acid export membrane protein
VQSTILSPKSVAPPRNILSALYRRSAHVHDETIGLCMSSTSEEARSRHRYKRATVNGLTSLLAKLIVLTTTIVSVPLTYRYLGAERYGLWMTITSCVLFLGFADFGVGNGLTAGIAAAHGRENRQEARRQVSCGFFLLALIAGLIAIGLVVCYPMIPWGKLYGVKTLGVDREAGPASAVMIFCTLLSMPVGTVLRIQLGYQEGYIGDLWNAGGNLLALAGILLATYLRCSLPILVCAVAGAPLLATTVNCLTQFFCVRPWLRPRFVLFDSKEALRLASVGCLFFVQQCFGLIYYVSDNIVISRIMGVEHVSQYAVMQRIFSIGLVAQYFMAPLWPAIGEAMVRRDFAWARTIVRRAIGFSLVLGTICGTVILLLSRYLMRRWSGIDLGFVDLTRIGFAIWVVLVGYIAAMNAILNQPEVMRRHLVIFGSASIVSLLLKIEFARHNLLAGVIWATIVGFGIFYIVPATGLALRSISDVQGGCDEAG